MALPQDQNNIRMTPSTPSELAMKFCTPSTINQGVMHVTAVANATDSPSASTQDNPAHKTNLVYNNNYIVSFVGNWRTWESFHERKVKGA